MRDSIALSEFLPTTQSGIRLLLEAYDLWEPESINWHELWFILRAVPDDEEFFPSGKWATIQRLEELLDEMAKTTIALVRR